MNIFYDHVFFEALSRTITELYTQQGRLPYTHYSRTYNSIGCMYNKPLIWVTKEGKRYHTAKFTEFYYTNDWNLTGASEDDYGYFFGPSIGLRDVLPDVWSLIPDDKRIALTAAILGSND